MSSKKHCAWGLCNSDSRNASKPHMQGVFFIPFPRPKRERAKCEKWSMLCNRQNFTADSVKYYTYICSKHFVGGSGPTKEHPDPIFASPDISKASNTKTKKVLAFSTPPINYGGEITNGSVDENTITDSNTNHDANCEESAEYPENMQVILVPAAGQLLPELDDSNSIGKTKKSRKRIKKGSEKELQFTMISYVPSNEELCNGQISEKHLAAISESYSSGFEITPKIIYDEIGVNVPTDWAPCYHESDISYYKFERVTRNIIIIISVDQQLNFECNVLGQRLASDHPYMTKFPETITSSREIVNAINELENWEFCCGNQDESFLTLFHEMRGFKNCHLRMETNSLHETRCNLLMLKDPKNGSRCKHCQFLRARLRAIKSRAIRSNKVEQTPEGIQFKSPPRRLGNSGEVNKKLKAEKAEKQKLKQQAAAAAGKLVKQPVKKKSTLVKKVTKDGKSNSETGPPEGLDENDVDDPKDVEKQSSEKQESDKNDTDNSGSSETEGESESE